MKKSKKKIIKNRRHSLAIMFFISMTFGLKADYHESDKYKFSFFLPGTYSKSVIKNDYGPFYQFERPDAKMYIHFWARKRPKSTSYDFLKSAYDQDFFNGFIQKKIKKDFAIAKNKGVKVIGSHVILLEQTYESHLYLLKKGNLFYLMNFIYRKGYYKDVKEDIELAINSFEYGR